MNRLQIDVPDSIAEELERQAKERGLSVSEYVRELLEQQAAAEQWPGDFFERVAGGWSGPELTRPEQGELENREQM